MLLIREVKQYSCTCCRPAGGHTEILHLCKGCREPRVYGTRCTAFDPEPPVLAKVASSYVEVRESSIEKIGARGLHLGIGVVLGPLGWAVLPVDPMQHFALLHHVAEATVVISLFTVGLKLRISFDNRQWLPPLILASVSMTLTVGLLTLIGVSWLHLPLGAAVLLAGILAPTDPVLASEVQVTHAGDRDELRTALSGEAGFNDGTAFPFIVLGLGLLGLHDLGAGGWRWWTIDVVWAIGGGLAIGAVLGHFTGKLILHMRIRLRKGVFHDEYLLLGLVGVAYGTSLLLHAYGFLAVFAAGVAVRAIERRHAPGRTPQKSPSSPAGMTDEQAAQHPELGPAYLAGSFLHFNEQLERVLELAMVMLIGAGLALVDLPRETLWFVPVAFLVVRPLSVLPLWWTRRFTAPQFAGIAWFGLRGIGSIYYLMYSITEGLSEELSRRLIGLTFVVIASSVVIHGISATPIMKYIVGRKRR